MKPVIPPAVLAQHIAIIGKTGAGKTTTGKLAIEQVVPQGARVCILDPIKSDWWGLTSSADGKRPGLPFQILGGPHGHVPLHASAGKAIGEIVANGSLPLSIIDMADFEAGGAQKFFVDFAPALLRHMRGVLYLVLEEAHEFAPKERAGFGAENMAVYYAKKIATAGRSKGIRMIVMTHSVQQLHNRVLGACDTLIAQRLTAPADQKPILDWLKANVSDKQMQKAIAASLSSLKTGTGWLCAGEAGTFERVAFPRISTYDNSATPTAGSRAHEVAMAPVDTAKLRALVGEAVTEAEANDPKKLKERIRALERMTEIATPDVARDMNLADAETRGYLHGKQDGEREGYARGLKSYEQWVSGLRDNLIVAMNDSQKTVFGALDIELARQPQPEAMPPSKPAQFIPRNIPAPVKHPATHKGNGDDGLSTAARKILAVLAQHPDGCNAGRLALLTGYSYSGGFRNALSELRTLGYLEGSNTGTMRITRAGLALGPFDPLPTGEALRQHWLGLPHFSSAAKKILGELLDRPRGASAEQLAAATGYEYSGGFRNALSELRTAGVLVGKNTGTMTASEELLA